MINYRVGKVGLAISSSKGKVVSNALGDEKGELRYKYNILIVSNIEIVLFNYFGSINAYENGKDWLTFEDLRSVLHCVVSDAISGLMTFDDFCTEFGYSNDSIKARGVYRECRKSYSKLVKLGLSEKDMYEILDDENLQ